MAKSKMKRKRTARSVLKLPDLEQSKSAVLNSLTSASSQRTYDHAIREFIEWYCSEPRLAFNKTVVTRYRISLEQQHYAFAGLVHVSATKPVVNWSRFIPTRSRLCANNGAILAMQTTLSQRGE
jgi:hypothetical protein